jgi:hypothetical protein
MRGKMVVVREFVNDITDIGELSSRLIDAGSSLVPSCVLSTLHGIEVSRQW